MTERLLIALPTIESKPILHSHLTLVDCLQEQLQGKGNFEIIRVLVHNMPPTKAYETMANTALDNKADKLIIIEDDNVLPKNFYENILFVDGSKDKSFVNSYVCNTLEGKYHVEGKFKQKETSIAPNAFYWENQPLIYVNLLPNQGIKEVYYTGFNGCVIHTNIFKELGIHLFENVYKDGEKRKDEKAGDVYLGDKQFEISWDCYFDDRIREAGYKIWVNTNVILPHIKKCDVTLAYIRAFEYGRAFGQKEIADQLVEKGILRKTSEKGGNVVKLSFGKKNV